MNISTSVSVETQEKKKHRGSNRLDAFAFFMVFVVGFMLSFFFTPPFAGAVDVGKSVFLSTLVTISFFLWLVARLKDGRLVFPNSIVLFAGGVLPVVFLLSSVFSAVPKMSLVGLGIETGTFSTILLLFILMFLGSIFFQQKERVFYLYTSFSISALLIFIYQTFRYVMLSFQLPFAGIFAGLPANVVGKWSDMGMFFGFVLLLSISTIELALPKNKIFKWLLYMTIAASFAILVAINFDLLWLIIAFLSLVIFVYGFSFGGKRNSDTGRKLPALSFTTLIISLFFVLAGNLIGGALFSAFNIPQETIRPTWGQTLEVARGTLVEHPIFGSGPSRFANEWLLRRPDGVNNSPLWNIDFESGVGLVPSFAVTTGIVGGIAWVVFLVVFLYCGIFVLFSAKLRDRPAYLVFSAFISSLYLWVLTIVYVPNIVIFSLAFLMTGVFIAMLVSHNLASSYKFFFLEDPRVGFVSVLVLVLLVLGSLGGGYLLFQKFLSVGYFQKSVSAYQNDGDLSKAEVYISQAIRLNQSDIYFRIFSEINIARLRGVLSQSAVSQDTVKSQFLTVSQFATENALNATAIDGENYQNWLSLGHVYEALMPFGAPEEFYQNAKSSYDKALALNPKSPSILLAEARLELGHKNVDGSKNYIAQALNERSAYTEAIFLLSQIQADEGNLKDAIASADVASRISPTDIGVFFHLGYLKYSNKDYQGAISALGRAVEIAPNYLNARYFLGLSYQKIGERGKAIEQFETIDKYEPGNSDVRKVLNNLRSGVSAEEAISQEPESPVTDPETPPIEE
ncbi:MAG: hypothetical protein COZ49_01685 [Candidatus Yonathbacteria bacterium CG_4_10_14_3_um_filter_47_65]|uniref:Uncharacterized protein n=2 Tax=Parcubacteria group TaxID=1794811 RepID=A0A2M8D846_9BACT|nr:MAG: hypothetical protein AUJ44_01070 [Candidatus Nomurabacteria bacterium CG1_02_47_685]PIP04128.1 MAG: hypothetical protein COX54_00740 [Candidatus Yonathbacteria bacterium CG23_combo_of_CG06-09_8_20_14_all_46_18]PIQ31261.1 MAG: hypothetical protein COW61_03990 [Candidatus Yonathbacteria bacterium CG17_big_fil_post_rev_8_21_14_2_50_46_19]PIX56514.1 MAG: hypothetical protein COZ49_01685 [Candidatus Yonathbacteria bacterium CG_4_10_14_3_um_filter_47_65]PIY57766.1 MAG: hypothetical protein CO